MSKRILLAVGVVALIFAGCSPSAEQASSGPPRFVEIDSSGEPFSIYVDTMTDVEYARSDGYSHPLTLLVDADGKPLKYNAETGR